MFSKLAQSSIKAMI
ncbi:hypothetical protein V5G59_004932 [Escherichia coli]|nr:hypothetical protein [Escherichia coli]EHJ4626078.1 hypothetical protein [Escherichia coli]EHL3187624.1 hypothetical protein [Escherichia coli]EHM1323626.1 hypothetical protein [Escherichia coli]EID1808139.1 hypothetical protein [Escherichia coli]EIM8214033.1 hypothetical protein [Escherichia coli]